MSPQQAAVALRFVDWTELPEPLPVRISHGCSLAGQRGVQIGVLSIQGAHDYAVIVHLDNGRTVALSPMRIYPERVARAAHPREVQP